MSANTTLIIPASPPQGMLAAVGVYNSEHVSAISPLQQPDTTAPEAMQSASSRSCLTLDEYIDWFGPDLPQSWLQDLSPKVVEQLMPAPHPDWPIQVLAAWANYTATFPHIHHPQQYPAAFFRLAAQAGPKGTCASIFVTALSDLVSTAQEGNHD